MFCQCEHRANSHRYMVTIKANGGECLSRVDSSRSDGESTGLSGSGKTPDTTQCPCTSFQEER